LDIDADFMFRPRTCGNPRIRQRCWIEPGEFVGRLEEAGLDWDASPMMAFTDHKEAYFVWREWGAHSATLVHVDAHSDFYDTFPWLVHCGNFLRRAAGEGMFSKIVWVVPRWLYDAGEWERWDTPGVRLSVGRKRLSYHQKGRCREGRGTAFEIVPHDRFLMPNSRVVLMTLATSPAFVPADGLPLVKDLVSSLGQRCSRVVVRPHIPGSLENPVLRRLWTDVRREGREGGAVRLRRSETEAREPAVRRLLGYLWIEHEAFQRCHEEARPPWVAGGLAPTGLAPTGPVPTGPPPISGMCPGRAS
jgi:hypothetical protein